MVLKRAVSNLAFRRAFIWTGWGGSAGCLPYALKAVNSLIGAMRRCEALKKELVKREMNTIKALGTWKWKRSQLGRAKALQSQMLASNCPKNPFQCLQSVQNLAQIGLWKQKCEKPWRNEGEQWRKQSVEGSLNS